MAQFSNKSLIATVRVLARKESAFNAAQSVFVVRALQGLSLTAAQQGHAVRWAKRVAGEATKKESQARAAAILELVSSADTRKRYAHATAADAASAE